ncbi:MAG: polysaccharide deacetylase family protein [Anaeromyxobacteraceae bacterium]
MRRTLKAALAGALCAAGARQLVRAVRRREAGGPRVLLLSYHRVSLDFHADAADSLPSLLVSADTLHRQLSQLARERDVVSLDDACRILAEPPARRPTARDVAVITFDDGYVGVHAHALPVLRDLRMPATVFMATGFADTTRRLAHDRLWGTLRELWRRRIPPAAAALPAPVQELLDSSTAPGPAATLDRLISRLRHDELVSVAAALEARLGTSEQDLPEESRLMTWDELRELEASRVAVGGHTVNHAVLANLPISRARAEIDGCMRDLRLHLAPGPRHFAYPNGYYTPAVKRAVRDAGFVAAVTTEDEENRRGGDLWALRRKVLWENSTLGFSAYSPALAACNLDSVFAFLGCQRAVPGERPDSDGEESGEPERAVV